LLLTLLPRIAPIVLGAALRIESEVACPEPSEVSANLQRIVELSDESAAGLHASTQRDGSWLVLRLTGSDGNSLGERRIAYEGDCQMLARAAAVVLAAWLSNEHPEFLVALPPEGWESQVETAAEIDPPAVEANPSTNVPAANAPAAPSPAAPAPRAAAPAPAAPSTMERVQRRLALGAGLGAAFSGSFAPALALSAAWDPGLRGWGARVGLAWLGVRTEPLGEREVSWTRWPLLAGPFLRLHAGRASFDLEAGGALGWARLGGHGFNANATDSGVTVGSYAALRFVPNDAPLHAFVMAAPLFWFHNATAVATNASGATVTRSLPPFEVLLMLGAELPL